MCDEKYRLAYVKDAYLKTNVVCLKEICGFYGKGPGCSNNVGIEGCDKSIIVSIKDSLTESCERCSPGYYRTTKTESFTDTNEKLKLVEVGSCSPIN
jgi:hypothetical protein